MKKPDNSQKTKKQLIEESEILRQRLKKALADTVNAISRTCELRDPYTAGHEYRVTQLALSIADEMTLTKDQKEGLRIASSIHDIGKISIPSEILSKAGELSDTELTMIKIHVQTGFDIIRNIDFSLPVAEIMLQHHEHLDGSGYPLGLSNSNILMEAKILTVADVVEAMSSHRPYRPALGVDKALEEITVNKGILYDANVVDACLRVFKEKGFYFKD
jgi:putative nucleotidyltransferase with HDIG domain